MTNVKFEIYHSLTWNDYTPYLTGFHVDDYGIQRVRSATVNLEGARSAFATYLSMPFKLVRLTIKGTDEIFYGFVDNPYSKILPGVSNAAQQRLSLDCVGGEQRFVNDYVTFDYYKLQSAISPYDGASAWTFRKMLQDALDHPDSTRDHDEIEGIGATGFQIDADADTDGIDHLIDSSCSWDKQTLLDMIRTACDRIGYDGYFNVAFTGTPSVKLAAFNKDSVETLTAPFRGEPEINYGSLSDVCNVIHCWGDVDAGVPSDGDRWTEYAVAKYDPAIWSAATYDINGNPTASTITLSDEPNVYDNNDVNGGSPLSNSLQAGANCLKITVANANSSTRILKLTLDLTNLPTLEAIFRVVDCLNRITQLSFNMKNFCSPSNMGNYNLKLHLYDTNNNHVQYYYYYDYKHGNECSIQTAMPNQANPTEDTNSDPILSAALANHWFYVSPSTMFNLSAVNKAVIELNYQNAASPAQTWGLYLDALQFEGGCKIEPFHDYSPTLNPPAVDASSIATYGVHELPYQNTLITSFEQAAAEKARLLVNLAAPFKTLTCTKYADDLTASLRPSNVVTVDDGVHDNDYRITKLAYDWKAEDKRCKTTLTLVNKIAPLPPIWTQINELRYFVK